MKFIHEWDANGDHRLIVDGVKGKWASYRYIAHCGDYAATSEYYLGEMPRIFKITEVVEVDELVEITAREVEGSRPE